jgi:type I restriction enzyme S subunit
MNSKTLPVSSEQWLQCTLGDLGVFRKGSGIRKHEGLNHGIPCVRYGEIYTTYRETIQKCHSFIDRRTASESELLEYGDVIFAVSGETSEDIGKCSTFLGSYEAYAGSDTLILRPKGVDPIYLGYALNFGEVLKQKQLLGQGDAVVHLSLANLLKVKMSLPPISEQKVIGEYLSQVDAEIEYIGKLIAKKQDIKQGAMQQLLTGKTRLPGFRGEWKARKLDDIASPNPEVLPSITPPEYKFSYISLEGVLNGSINTYAKEVFRSAPSRARRTLRNGDVLFGTVRPNLRSHAKYEGGLTNPVASTGFCVLRAKPGLGDYSFIFYFVMSEIAMRQIEMLLAGSNYPSVNSSDVGSLLVMCPEYEEQKAIAEVLSDMDAEIDALVARREKTALIKTGMMRELLTGRTRLV